MRSFRRVGPTQRFPSIALMAGIYRSSGGNNNNTNNYNITTATPMATTTTTSSKRFQATAAAQQPATEEPYAAGTETPTQTQYEEYNANDTMGATTTTTPAATAPAPAATTTTTTETGVAATTDNADNNKDNKDNKEDGKKTKSPAKPRKVIDIATLYDPRLQQYSNAALESVQKLPPEDAVTLAAQYIHMQHYIHGLAKGRRIFKNVPRLSKLHEEALLSAALAAVDSRAVSLELAVKLLRTPLLTPGLSKHRRFLRHALKAWIVETILAEKMTPALAYKSLFAARQFGRDARVIGTLAQKAVEDMNSLSPEKLIRVMYCVSDSHVQPPTAFFTSIVRCIVEHMHKDGLSPRQCYRTLEVCARCNILTDINMLAQLSEYCWRQIALKATEAAFSPRKMIRPRAALRRLGVVSGLTPAQFFRLIQLSGRLGSNFNAGRGVITDSVLVPLVWHLNSHHVSELIESLYISRSRYPPIFQAIIDRVVHRGTNSPACLLHVSRLLRCISHHSDLCSQLRLAKFFDLMEEVCKHKHVLRVVQMMRLVDDMYFISRRFSRTAPIVLRMNKIVDEFCSVIVMAVESGVAALEHVNRVLELTVMMGISKKKTEYVHVAQLREMRRAIYATTQPGEYPVAYDKRLPSRVRVMYNTLINCNQANVLFHQILTRRQKYNLSMALLSFGPYRVLLAASLYTKIHGRSLPLSPYLTRYITRCLEFSLRHAKVGDSAELLARMVGVSVLGKRELEFLTRATHVQCSGIPNLAVQTFYLKYLEAAATALNDAETLEKVHELSKKALY